jgi:hypothetical protein
MRREDHPARGFLQLGFFVGGGGFVLALFQPRDSAEFVLSVCSAAMGGFIVVGSLLITRLLKPRE